MRGRCGVDGWGMRNQTLFSVAVAGMILGLGGCSLFESEHVETSSRPIASSSSEGGAYSARLDTDRPSAYGDPLPSWTVTSVESNSRYITLIDPETGLFVRREVQEQTLREDPWLAAPITLPETEQSSDHHDRRRWDWGERPGRGDRPGHGHRPGREDDDS